jgi:hypothetical protein
MHRSSRLLTMDQSPDLGRWVEPTTYREPENPVYKGNPLIEALPKPWSVKEVINLLKHYPDFDPSHRLLPQEERLDMIENVAQVFQPLSEHIALQRRFSRAIRGGYVGRDLFDIPTVEKTARRIQSDPSQRSGRSQARGFYMIGMSGMGKTTSTEAILGLYPQVIWHSEYQGQPIMRTQVTWLKLDCPYDGSTRALCFAFFSMLDRLLGTNYYAAYAQNGNATVAKMQIYMAFLCELLNVGLLVIDEIQHLNRAKSGGAQAMLNFFVGLSNAIRIPVVLIGTYHAFDIFTKEFRQMRRGTRQGNFIWQRMKSDDPSWETLLKGIWKYQYVHQPAELTPELSDALYYVTQGVTDLVITVFILAQERAITDGMETICPSTIYSVAADSMEIAYKPLQDIRTNAATLQEYDDVVMPIEFEDAYVRQPRGSGVAGSTNGKSVTSGSIPEARSPSPHGTIQTERGQPQNSPPHVVPSERDLRRSLQPEVGELDPYEALKASGHISRAQDYVRQEGEPC